MNLSKSILFYFEGYFDSQHCATLFSLCMKLPSCNIQIKENNYKAVFSADFFAACRPFLKLYQAMQPVYTSGI